MSPRKHFKRTEEDKKEGEQNRKIEKIAAERWITKTIKSGM